MVNEFKKWLVKNNDRITNSGLSTVDIYENTTNQKCDSIVITYETPIYICDINVQDDGHINVEVLSQKSGDVDFCIYCMTKKKFSISHILNSFLSFIEENRCKL